MDSNWLISLSGMVLCVCDFTRIAVSTIVRFFLDDKVLCYSIIWQNKWCQSLYDNCLSVVPQNIFYSLTPVPFKSIIIRPSISKRKYVFSFLFSYMQIQSLIRKMMFLSTLPSFCWERFHLCFIHVTTHILKYSELLILRVNLQKPLCQLLKVVYHGIGKGRFINWDEQTKVWSQFKSQLYYGKIDCYFHVAESQAISAQDNLYV